MDRKNKAEWAAYMRDYSRRGRETNPAKWTKSQRSRHYKHRYGITAEKYDELLALQGGSCAICKKKCTSGRRLAIDHDHETDHVRGLLCARCNRGIGLLKDDPELLRVAAGYIDGETR